MKGPSFDGSVMLANICTMPISVRSSRAGTQSPMARRSSALHRDVVKIVAVAFEIVANEIRAITVGDEANALGKKRILDFDLFETDRPLLPRNLGQTGQFIDQIAWTHSPKCKGEFGAERQAVEDRRQRKSYECGSEGSAKKSRLRHGHRETCANRRP